MLTDDGRRTDDGRTTDTFIYYKLTNEPSAQVSLKYNIIFIMINEPHRHFPSYSVTTTFYEGPIWDPYDLNDIGDNFHYLLVCPYFLTDRKRYLSSRFYTRPNILLYQELLAISGKNDLEKLSVFTRILMNKFSNV